MLTHARIFEMNITICKHLQTRLPVSEPVFKALEARIMLFVKLLEAVEKVSLIRTRYRSYEDDLILSRIPARKLHHHPRHRKVRYL